MDTKQNNDKTLETNGKITDELVAKYISGNTTEEEDGFIHDYLARNPEFANDLLDIATALRHQHKHDAAIKKEKQEESKEAKRIQITPPRTFYAIAASVVVLIGIGLLLYLAPSSDGEEFVLESVELCDTVFSFQEYNCDDLMSEEMSADNIFLSGIPDSLIYDDLSYSDIEEISAQETEIVTEHKSEALSLADNSVSESQPQQEPVSPSDNSDASMMASLTVSEDDDNVLQKKDGVFTIDIPKTCNRENGIVLKWNCNASSLKLEISTDRKTWKTLNNNIIQHNSLTITPSQLKDFEMSNSECFYWRMTAQFSDGPLRKEGIVYYSKENN